MEVEDGDIFKRFLNSNCIYSTRFSNSPIYSPFTTYLNGNLINLVQDIDAGNVDSITLDNINQIINRRITPEINIRIVDLVFRQHGLYRILVNVVQRDVAGHVDPASLLFPEIDVGRLLVQPDPVALQFLFNDSFVSQGFQHILM